MAEILEKDVTYNTAGVAVVTTTETILATSPQIKVPVQTARVLVKGFCLINPGTGATALNFALRRGTAVTGTRIDNNLTRGLAGAAGTVEEAAVQALDSVNNVESVQYVLTCKQTAATGNASVDEAVIEVEVLNG